jgi:hypothetical protein
MADNKWGVTGAEFAFMIALGHTRAAHVDEQICTEPTCASVRLLAEHPDDWQYMTLEQFRVWLLGSTCEES